MNEWLVAVKKCNSLGGKMQEENNGEHVRYLIREWKVLWPLLHYLPTSAALNMVLVIEVAIGVLTFANTFTITLEPWNLKTIYQFIVDVFTGDIWVIVSRPRCQEHLLYFTQVHHIGCIRSTNLNISIPLEMRSRSVRRRLSIVNASRSAQIEWRIHWLFTAHQNHIPR